MVNVRNCTIKNFLDLISYKKIICFCAGQKFLELCEKFNIAEQILYVVDNFKFGTSIKINNCNIPIVSADKIGKEATDCILLISTMRYSVQIIEQLDKISILNGLSVFIPDLFIPDEEHIILSKKNNIIPKTIHYCWFGKNDMPAQFKNNIETWKRFCPDYQIICWDENNYDISKNKYMLQAYQTKKWGFVPDYARLDIIYENGGIYLDTDVELLKSFDELLSYNMFCGFESQEYVALGLGFGAIKRNKIIYEMMRKYDDISFINEDGSLNLIASPVYQTETLKKMGLIQNGKTQKIRDSLILSPEYLAPINAFGFGTPTINSFSIHQYAASWCDEKMLEAKETNVKICNFIKARLKK